MAKACHARLGDIEAARRVIDRLRSTIPNYDPWNVEYLCKEEHRELVLSALRMILNQESSTKSTAFTKGEHE